MCNAKRMDPSVQLRLKCIPRQLKEIMQLDHSDIIPACACLPACLPAGKNLVVRYHIISLVMVSIALCTTNASGRSVASTFAAAWSSSLSACRNASFSLWRMRLCPVHGVSTASGAVGILEDAHPDKFLELVDLGQEVRMCNVTGYMCMVGVT